MTPGPPWATLPLREQLDLMWLRRALRGPSGDGGGAPYLLPVLRRCLQSATALDDCLALLTAVASEADAVLAPRALVALAELMQAVPYLLCGPQSKLRCLGGPRIGGESFGVEQYEAAAMACIAHCVGTATVERHAADAAAAVPAGHWAVARAPARVDLAGGWTDTPPICYEVGGTVVNLAITVDGQKPIGARARRTPDRLAVVIVMRERAPRPGDANGGDGDGDGEQRLVLTRREELACTDPRDPGALAKAVVLTLGVIDESAGAPSLSAQLTSAGGGLELQTWSELPHGSGLGTSSILAGALVAAVAAAVGVRLDQAALTHTVLKVEQRLTTGGGWQDQLGGLVGGAKLCTCQPALPLKVECAQVDLDMAARATLTSHLQLIFTGQVRLARNLLRDVLRRWLLGRPQSVANIDALVETAHQMAHALHAADVPSVGRHLSRYWAQKKRMCDAEPPAVAAMLRAIRPLIHGGALAGAGGGGFLLVVTKQPHAADALRAALRGTAAELYDVAIDSEGLVVSVEGR